MYLIKVKCDDEHNSVDYMLKKNMMNDYIFNNTFITFVFGGDLQGISSLFEFKSYLHRLLWETVFMKNSKISTHEVLKNHIRYYIRCNLSEVLQFLEAAVPPALKKGHKVIELVDDVKSVMGTCETLLTEEHTMKTNYSYFYNIMRVKKFDWQSSYPVQRAATISKYLSSLNDDKSKSMTTVISDLMVGNANSIDVSNEVIVAFTFNDDEFLEFLKKTQSDLINQNFFVTDLTFTENTTSVTVVTNLGKVDQQLYVYIRDTYEALTSH